MTNHFDKTCGIFCPKIASSRSAEGKGMAIAVVVLSIVEAILPIVEAISIIAAIDQVVAKAVFAAS